MLKRVPRFWDLNEARCSRAIRIHISRDQFVIFAAHDPIVLAMQHQSWHFHLRPRRCEVEILQLLIKREWSAVKMSVIFSFGPQRRELRVLAQDFIDRFVLDQPIMIKRRRVFHASVYFGGRLTHQGESAPLDFEHVLEPRLHPTADCDVTLHLCLLGGRFRNQRRESAAIADTKDVNLIGVDEVVIL